MKIYFTQCDPTLKPNHRTDLPIIPKLELFEYLLLNLPDDTPLYTYDEHLLLIAQYFKRKGKIQDLTFVSICTCRGERQEMEIPIDEDGNFTDDPHHGFFPQRLEYF